MPPRPPSFDFTDGFFVHAYAYMYVPGGLPGSATPCTRCVLCRADSRAHDGKVGSKRPASRSPARGGKQANTSSGPAPGAAAGARKVDYATMPPCKLAEHFNVPTINSRVFVLNTQDLSCRFPNLYLPADLVRVDVEWADVLHGLRSDVCKRIYLPVPVILETNVGTLAQTAPAAAPVPAAAGAVAVAVAAEEKAGESASAEAAPPPAPVIAALELPRFTYVTPQPQDGYGVHHSVAPRPIKFNARVLVTLGLTELEADKIDHLFARRLRVLCGRRKKAATLLGGSWCAELDGGNPMEDRGCLLNTARRALLAQSLLDLAGGAGCRCNIVKLGEVSYHRPQEEYNGRSFPEQEECTALFLCVLQVRDPCPFPLPLYQTSPHTPCYPACLRMLGVF